MHPSFLDSAGFSRFCLLFHGYVAFAHRARWHAFPNVDFFDVECPWQVIEGNVCVRGVLCALLFLLPASFPVVKVPSRRIISVFHQRCLLGH